MDFVGRKTELDSFKIFMPPFCPTPLSLSASPISF
jgi:hypothetical protein